MSKRKRDPAFQQSEKVLLVELVEKHYSTIESKKTDAVSVREKNDEWRKITMEFNATSGLHTRDWIVIKNCWENLKKKAKSQITQANQSFLATGGGPPKSFTADPIIERVTNLIRPTVTGFINEFDADGTLVLASGNTADCELQLPQIKLQKQEHEDIYSQIVLYSNESHESPGTHVELVHESHESPGTQIELVHESHESTGKQVELVHSFIDNPKDWSNYSPAMLRAPKKHILRTEKTCPRQFEQQEFVSISNSNNVNIEPILQPSCSNVQSSYEATPVKFKTQSVSRRRPVLNQSQALTQQKVDSLLAACRQAKEQHEAQMRILKLQEEREMEMLKQERLQTEQEQLRILILKEELHKLQQ